MRYEIDHKTTLRYNDEVLRSYNKVHLRPLDSATQRVYRYELQVIPACSIARHRGLAGQITETFDVADPHRMLEVRARSSVDVQPRGQQGTGPDWATLDRLRTEGPWFEYTLPSRYVDPQADPEAVAYLRSFATPWEGVRALTGQTNRSFTFDPHASYVGRSLHELLHSRRGVCQDFAHYLCSVFRGAGLPALYVSGYLAHAETVESSASHAWVEILWPDGTTLELDPTNPEASSEQRIRLAVGVDYDDVAPLKGVYLGHAEQQLEVAISLSTSDRSPLRQPDRMVLARRKAATPPFIAGQQQ
jgi:transglutaminase-like putative cysteine protease